MKTFLEFVNEKILNNQKLPMDVYNFIKNFIVSNKSKGNITITYQKSTKNIFPSASEILVNSIMTKSDNKAQFLSQEWTPKLDGKYIDKKSLQTMLEKAIRMMIDDGTLLIVRRDANVFKDNAKGYRYDLVYTDEYEKSRKSDVWNMGNPTIITKI